MSSPLKKKSFVVHILFGFWIFYVIFSLGLYFFKARNDLSHFTENRKDQLNVFFTSISPFLESRQFIEVKKMLDLNHAIGQFDFAILKVNNKTVYTINGNETTLGSDPRVEGDYPPRTGFYESSDVALKTVEVLDYKLTLGLQKISSDFYVHLFKKEGLLFGFVFLVVTVVLGFFIFNNLKDIIKLTQILKEKNINPLYDIKSTSEEAEILLAATKSHIEQNKELEELAKKLEHAVSPALLHILKQSSLKKDEIGAQSRVLVSMDWNDHTKMVFKEGLDSIDDLRENLFTLCDELILRYKGLRVESISDSITFWMEDENLVTAKQLAICCVRDIFNLIDTNSKIFLNLKFKCVLVVGAFEFKKTSFDYKLSSLAWYEANRTFKSVPYKDRNCLMILERDQDGLSHLCEFGIPRRVEFQGFPEKISIIDIEKFKTIQDSLESIELINSSNVLSNTTSNTSLNTLNTFKSKELIESLDEKQEKLKIPLELFKNDEDIKFLLNYFTTMYKKYKGENKSEAEILLLLQPYLTALRSVSVRQVLLSENSLSQVFLNTLKYFKETDDYKIFSGLVSLAKNILTFTTFTQGDDSPYSFYKSLTNFQNYRVVANVIDAISEFIPDEELLITHLNHPNNRVLGNVILNLGADQLSDQLIQKIDELYNHSNPNFIATGLYVDSFLYQKYFMDDPRYCKTNDYLKTIPLKIFGFTKSENLVVKNRAIVSLSKFDKLIHENYI